MQERFRHYVFPKQAANLLTGRKSAYPWMFHEDQDFMLLEGYIRTVKNQLEKLQALDPFAEKFAEKFPSQQPRSMRDFKHTLNLIKVYALFHFAQRPLVIRKVKHGLADLDDPAMNCEAAAEAEEQYVMVTRQDYEFIMALWQNIRETTETSAPGHVLKFYHEIVKGLAQEKEEFTVEDMTERWNSKSEDEKSSYTIRRWAEFLCNIGYLTSSPDPNDKRRLLFKVIHVDAQKTCNPLHFQNANIFKLETLKSWLKTAEKIFAHNTLTLKESILNQREISIEELHNKYFLDEGGMCANIFPSQNQASSSREASKLFENEKCKQLQIFKAVYWGDGFYGWHKCAVCSQTKLTNWKAETFHGENVWLCEDCKEAWEKTRGE